MRWAVDLQFLQLAAPLPSATLQALALWAAEMAPDEVIWWQRGDLIDLSQRLRELGAAGEWCSVPVLQSLSQNESWQGAADASWWAEVHTRQPDVVLLPYEVSSHTSSGLPSLVGRAGVRAIGLGASVLAASSEHPAEEQERTPLCYTLQISSLGGSPARLRWQEALAPVVHQNSHPLHANETSERQGTGEGSDLQALRAHVQRRKNQQHHTAGRPKLAWVSPLPPVPSGIADFSAELLPEMAAYYDVSAVMLHEVSNDQRVAGIEYLSLARFRERAHEFHRVLYHFGNSPYHVDILALLRELPGVVVLHDVYLGHLVAHAQHSGRLPQALRRALWVGHGVPALQHWREAGEAEVLARYACCADIVAQSRGLIVHSQHSLETVQEQMQAALPVTAHVVPLAQAQPAQALDRAASRKALGVEPSQFVFCAFGYAGAGKMSVELVQAFRLLCERLAQPTALRLVLVGDHQMSGAPAAALGAELANTPQAKLTGHVSAAEYRHWLAAADVAVQLRANSRGETSRAVLEAMANGLPVVVNDHGANRELVDGHGMLLSAQPSIEEIANALEAMLNMAPAERAALAEAGKERVAGEHSPTQVAQRYAEAIELGWRTPGVLGSELAWIARMAERGVQLEWSLANRWARHRAGHRAVRQPAGNWQARWLPPLEAVSQAPRRVAEVPAGGFVCEVIVVSGGRLDDPHCGADYRSRRLRTAYEKEGWRVRTMAPAELAAQPGLSHGSLPRIWHLDSPASWRAWHEVQSGATGRAWVVYAPNEAPRDDLDRSSHEQALGGANLVILPVEQGAWRNSALLAGDRALVLAPTAAPWLSTPSVRTAIARDHLPREPFAVLIGNAQPATVEAAEAMLLPSLAWLPPRTCLLLVGAIGPALAQRPAWQRWAGVNSSRAHVLGEVAAQTWDAIRSAAAVHVVPRGVAAVATGMASMRMLDGLASPAHVLATSAALCGLAPHTDALPGVVVADRSAEFQWQLRHLLQAPLPSGRLMENDEMAGTEEVLARIRQYLASAEARAA